MVSQRVPNRWTFFIVVLLAARSLAAEKLPRLILETSTQKNLEHPSDIELADGGYLVTELFANKLVYVKSQTFSDAIVLKPEKIGKSFSSPHFIAKRPEGGYLVSEGWGRAIVSMDDVSGANWKRFEGPDHDELWAPHGVCISRDGWIYVADSLNSRLVRFRNLDGDRWQVFPDHDRKIAYGRQILCNDQGIWMANSYEARDGLNQGRGSNVLLITDFESGKTETMASFPRSNMTGIALLDERWFVVGLWSGGNRLVVVEKKTREVVFESPPPSQLAGTPYGMRFDERTGKLFVTYTGDISNLEKRGGVAVFKVLMPD